MKLKSGQVWTFTDARGIDFEEHIDFIENDIVHFHSDDHSKGKSTVSDYFSFNYGNVKGLNVLATFKNMVKQNA